VATRGSQMIPYGTVINDAVRSPRSKLADLVALRDHTKAMIAAQGDLKGALKKLTTEIARREKELGPAKKR
jgi:uncharacterized protein DUF1843